MSSLASLYPPPGAFNEGDPAHVAAMNQFLHASKHSTKDYEALKEALMPYEPTTVYDASGLTIEVLGRRTGRDFNVGTPFQFFDATEDENQPQVLINLHSHLAKTINAGDKITITGLDEPFPVKAGDYIYLKADIHELACTGATVVHGGKWDGYPEAIQWNGIFPNQVQSAAFLELGYVVAASEDFEYDPPGLLVGDLIVIQNVRTHLIMQLTCSVNGQTALYFAPWWGLHIPSW